MKPISEEKAIALLANGFEQAVGHPATADVLTQRTGLDIKFNRMNVRLAPGDTLIIAQVVVPRLAEGQILSQEEVEALPVQWWRIQDCKQDLHQVCEHFTNCPVCRHYTNSGHCEVCGHYIDCQICN
jgi:hypothetical protein